MSAEDRPLDLLVAAAVEASQSAARTLHVTPGEFYTIRQNAWNEHENSWDELVSTVARRWGLTPPLPEVKVVVVATSTDGSSARAS